MSLQCVDPSLCIARGMPTWLWLACPDIDPHRYCVKLGVGTPRVRARYCFSDDSIKLYSGTRRCWFQGFDGYIKDIYLFFPPRPNYEPVVLESVIIEIDGNELPVLMQKVCRQVYKMSVTLGSRMINFSETDGCHIELKFAQMSPFNILQIEMAWYQECFLDYPLDGGPPVYTFKDMNLEKIPETDYLGQPTGRITSRMDSQIYCKFPSLDRLTSGRVYPSVIKLDYYDVWNRCKLREV